MTWKRVAVGLCLYLYRVKPFYGFKIPILYFFKPHLDYLERIKMKRGQSTLDLFMKMPKNRRLEFVL